MRQYIASIKTELISRINILPRMKDEDRIDLAIDLFSYQYKYNETYREFVDLLRVLPSSVDTIEKIPFLPIMFFKNYEIKTGNWKSEMIFYSSGTTGSINSQHHVKNSNWYLEKSFIGFNEFFNSPREYAYLALLPSYLEKGQSSLVAMVDNFIKKSKYDSSGFYLYDFEKLKDQLIDNESNKIPTIIFGVSYALLDFAEKYPLKLKHTIIIETGGMKGRRKEIPKQEMYQLLQSAFDLDFISSEYGMTELFAQAYSKGKGLYRPSSFMKVLIREPSDPLNHLDKNRTGGIDIIDYTNIDSCCFISTQDVGKCFEDGSFELLGRIDDADIRGCNLMVNDIL